MRNPFRILAPTSSALRAEERRAPQRYLAGDTIAISYRPPFGSRAAMGYAIGDSVATKSGGTTASVRQEGRGPRLPIIVARFWAAPAPTSSPSQWQDWFSANNTCADGCGDEGAILSTSRRRAREIVSPRSHLVVHDVLERMAQCRGLTSAHAPLQI